MNPNEINKRIAIACGWTHVEYTQHVDITWPWGYLPNDRGANHKAPIPNYYRDLNAMHEAESMLSDVISIKSYCHHLTSQAEPEYATEHLVRCSAGDKAEAFLRTIGQWEDDK